jgi:hypothetical protein
VVATHDAQTKRAGAKIWHEWKCFKDRPRKLQLTWHIASTMLSSCTHNCENRTESIEVKVIEVVEESLSLSANHWLRKWETLAVAWSALNFIPPYPTPWEMAFQAALSLLVVLFVSSRAWNGKSVENKTVNNLGRGVKGLASQTRREVGIPLPFGAWPSHFKTQYWFLIIMNSCIINFFPSHVMWRGRNRV